MPSSPIAHPAGAASTDATVRFGWAIHEPPNGDLTGKGNIGRAVRRAILFDIQVVLLTRTPAGPRGLRGVGS